MLHNFTHWQLKGNFFQQNWSFSQFNVSLGLQQNFNSYTCAQNAAEPIQYRACILVIKCLYNFIGVLWCILWYIYHTFISQTRPDRFGKKTLRNMMTSLERITAQRSLHVPPLLFSHVCWCNLFSDQMAAVSILQFYTGDIHNEYTIVLHVRCLCISYITYGCENNVSYSFRLVSDCSRWSQ